MSTNNERDTKFLGFAKLLYNDLLASESLGTDIIDSQVIEIIAQRAYDLASFAVYKSMRGCSLAQIPDITEWSTLTENRKFEFE